MSTAIDRTALRGFALGPPEGFVELPLDADELREEDFERLVDRMTTMFGITDRNAAHDAALSFAALGEGTGRSGADYTAVALYASPDEPQRPIMVWLTGIVMPSDHQRVTDGIEGLLEVHRSQARGDVVELTLPIGPAVGVLVEEQDRALAVGDEAFPIINRTITAWVPDQDGTAVGVVSISTNSWRDWQHVCTLALDVFDTFEWQPISA